MPTLPGSSPRYLLAQWPFLHRAGTEPEADRLPQKRQRFSGGGRCRRTASRRRPAQPGDHPQTTGLLDPDPRAEVLQEGTQPDESVSFLLHLADRILPELHLQTPLSHPQDLRAELRDRPVAADGKPDQRDLRRPARQETEWKTRYRARPDRAWSSCFQSVLETRLPETVWQVLRFLRNELCSNNLRDFGLKNGLDHLDAVRQRFLAITDRFAAFQAQGLNVHVDFPLPQRIALPITVGSVRYPGIKIHDVRIIRLLEVSPAQQQYCRRLDGQTDSSGRRHHVPAFPQAIQSESAALRPPQAQRARTAE